MKPSILVVMLDFLVCSLLLFVIGTGGKQTRFATSARPAGSGNVREEFAPAAIQAMQEQWNREYDQQMLLAQLNLQTTENRQLRGAVQSLSNRLDATSETLTAREREAQELKTLTAQREENIRALRENLRSLSLEKEQVEQQKRQIEQTLSSTETQLVVASEERGRLQQEKVNLEKRAEQLGQTIVSQQTTIQTLSEGVRTSQEKMETQFADFARGQQQMVATLGNLDEFARTLPSAIQTNMANVESQQRTLEDSLSALGNAVRDLQAELKDGERTNLLQAVADVARGQQGIQAQMADLAKAQGGEQVTKGLNAIQTGQDALRQQTAKLADQVEAIQAGKPGPFQAVRNSRLELLASITKRSQYDSTTSRFRSSAHPPVAKVGDRLFIVATDQNLGLDWALRSDFDVMEIAELRYTIDHRSDPAWSLPLDGAACVLAGNRHVVAVELTRPMTGLTAMEIAGPDALFHSDNAKLYVFKSTAAGLSFEVDTSPDLSAPDYLVVKRPLRGVASWFENPAYRPDAGDYVATADGKLVGIMINRERCLILSKDSIQACALSIPLADKRQFEQAAAQFRKLR